MKYKQLSNKNLIPKHYFSVGTLGRNGRRRPSMRTARRRQSSAATTLVHTTRRGSDTYLEVLPDLTQGNYITIMPQLHSFAAILLLVSNVIFIN